MCTCDFQDVPAVPKTTADISDESDGFSVEADEEERRGPNTSRGPAVARLEDEKLKTKTGSNDSSSSSPSCTTRTSCPYGKQCYRYVYLRRPQSRRSSINSRRSWFLVQWKNQSEEHQMKSLRCSFSCFSMCLLKEEPSALPGVQSPGRR